jgi:hypothetical protein
VFVAIWNVRDESVGWVAELSAVVGGEDGSRAQLARDVDDLGPAFEDSEQVEFSRAIELDAEGLLALVQSRSQYLVATEDEKRATAAAVGDLAARLPERFALPYVTRVVRARRR